MTRRDFGTTRRLPSGRWHARFSAPDGGRVAAERTFATRAEAAAYLVGVPADLEGARQKYRIRTSYALDRIDHADPFRSAG